MLAERGRRPVYRGPVDETHGATDQLNRPEFRMIHADYSVARDNLRMREYLGYRKKWSAWNVMRIQNCLPLGGGALAEHSFYFGKQAGAMLDAALIGRIARIPGPFRLVEGLAKTTPDAVIGDGYGDPRILASQHLIRDDAGMTAVESFRVLAGKEAGRGKV